MSSNNFVPASTALALINLEDKIVKYDAATDADGLLKIVIHLDEKEKSDSGRLIPPQDMIKKLRHLFENSRISCEEKWESTCHIIAYRVQRAQAANSETSPAQLDQPADLPSSAQNAPERHAVENAADVAEPSVNSATMKSHRRTEARSVTRKREEPARQQHRPASRDNNNSKSRESSNRVKKAGCKPKRQRSESVDIQDLGTPVRTSSNAGKKQRSAYKGDADDVCTTSNVSSIVDAGESSTKRKKRNNSMAELAAKCPIPRRLGEEAYEKILLQMKKDRDKGKKCGIFYLMQLHKLSYVQAKSVHNAFANKTDAKRAAANLANKYPADAVSGKSRKTKTKENSATEVGSKSAASSKAAIVGADAAGEKHKSSSAKPNAEFRSGSSSLSKKHQKASDKISEQKNTIPSEAHSNSKQKEPVAGKPKRKYTRRAVADKKRDRSPSSPSVRQDDSDASPPPADSTRHDTVVTARRRSINTNKPPLVAQAALFDGSTVAVSHAASSTTNYTDIVSIYLPTVGTNEVRRTVRIGPVESLKSQQTLPVAAAAGDLAEDIAEKPASSSRASRVNTPAAQMRRRSASSSSSPEVTHSQRSFNYENVSIENCINEPRSRRQRVTNIVTASSTRSSSARRSRPNASVTPSKATSVSGSCSSAMLLNTSLGSLAGDVSISPSKLQESLQKKNADAVVVGNASIEIPARADAEIAAPPATDGRFDAETVQTLPVVSLPKLTTKSGGVPADRLSSTSSSSSPGSGRQRVVIVLPEELILRSIIKAVLDLRNSGRPLDLTTRQKTAKDFARDYKVDENVMLYVLGALAAAHAAKSVDECMELLLSKQQQQQQRAAKELPPPSPSTSSVTTNNSVMSDVSNATPSNQPVSDADSFNSSLSPDAVSASTVATSPPPTRSAVTTKCTPLKKESVLTNHDESTSSSSGSGRRSDGNNNAPKVEKRSSATAAEVYAGSSSSNVSTPVRRHPPSSSLLFQDDLKLEDKSAVKRELAASSSHAVRKPSTAFVEDYDDEDDDDIRPSDYSERVNILNKLFESKPNPPVNAQEVANQLFMTVSELRVFIRQYEFKYCEPYINFSD